MTATKYMIHAGKMKGLNTAPRPPVRYNDCEVIDIDADNDGDVPQEPTPDHVVIPMTPSPDCDDDPCIHCHGKQRCPECNGTGETQIWYAKVCHPYTCAACNGTGQCPECSGDRHPGDGETSGPEDLRWSKPCLECDGSGDCTSCLGLGLDDEDDDCNSCDGSGQCPECNGTGVFGGGDGEDDLAEYLKHHPATPKDTKP